MSKTQSWIVLIGRIFLGILFFWAGSAKLFDIEGTMNYMASKKMPFVPFSLFGAIACQILGSLSLILGFKARWGSVLLAIFIIPATILFHDFWNLEGPERLIEKIMFMKDWAIFGGLLYIIAFGSGKYSLDKKV